MWSNSIPAALAAAALCTTTAIAQSNVTGEAGELCKLQLQTKAGVLERTDDWDLVPSTNTTLWPTAQLYLTSEQLSRMYGGDGGRCGFDPHLRCDDVKDFDSMKYGFYIASNGSLNFANRTVFWRCPNTDKADEQRDNAAPWIFPPVGAMDSIKMPSNCTAVNLTSTKCKAASSNEFTITSTSILTTAVLTGGAGSGPVRMNANDFFAEAVIGMASVLLSWL
ncbi:hypothetical protein LTR70_006918 [Exophiala xenobiotica]|uniref:Uncharacterized protein n=1 Tax=Lithohypha guttulata TaxID=1690604 RepID=A0ABR0K617_9EURO|nr:hypothetical protein LTR24_006569 [Lithohypha guttulata]KAK5314956.1 hypothetical protein LTR70_006918 [Exophiala xenobiotica]